MLYLQPDNIVSAIHETVAYIDIDIHNNERQRHILGARPDGSHRVTDTHDAENENKIAFVADTIYQLRDTRVIVHIYGIRLCVR